MMIVTAKLSFDVVRPGIGLDHQLVGYQSTSISILGVQIRVCCIV